MFFSSNEVYHYLHVIQDEYSKLEAKLLDHMKILVKSKQLQQQQKSSASSQSSRNSTSNQREDNNQTPIQDMSEQQRGFSSYQMKFSDFVSFIQDDQNNSKNIGDKNASKSSSNSDTNSSINSSSLSLSMKEYDGPDSSLERLERRKFEVEEEEKQEVEKLHDVIITPSQEEEEFNMKNLLSQHQMDQEEVNEGGRNYHRPDMSLFISSSPSTCENTGEMVEEEEEEGVISPLQSQNEVMKEEDDRKYLEDAKNMQLQWIEDWGEEYDLVLRGLKKVNDLKILLSSVPILNDPQRKSTHQQQQQSSSSNIPSSSSSSKQEVLGMQNEGTRKNG